MRYTSPKVLFILIFSIVFLMRLRPVVAQDSTTTPKVDPCAILKPEVAENLMGMVISVDSPATQKSESLCQYFLIEQTDPTEKPKTGFISLQINPPFAGRLLSNVKNINPTTLYAGKFTLESRQEFGQQVYIAPDYSLGFVIKNGVVYWFTIFVNSAGSKNLDPVAQKAVMTQFISDIIQPDGPQIMPSSTPVNLSGTLQIDSCKLLTKDDVVNSLNVNVFASKSKIVDRLSTCEYIYAEDTKHQTGFITIRIVLTTSDDLVDYVNKLYGEAVELTHMPEYGSEFFEKEGSVFFLKDKVIYQIQAHIRDATTKLYDKAAQADAVQVLFKIVYDRINNPDISTALP